MRTEPRASSRRINLLHRPCRPRAACRALRYFFFLSFQMLHVPLSGSPGGNECEFGRPCLCWNFSTHAFTARFAAA
jgi:hypothetical protein